MLRVLNQDGFDYTILPIVDAARSASDLLDHLNAGNAAAILISRRENGNMHWVAALKPANEKIVILDSLFPDPYSEEPIPFVRDCVLSCILIQPKGVPPETTNSPMRDGIDALRTTIKRYQEVRKIRRKQAE